MQKVFGMTVANCLALLFAVQFHLLFYASRPLPNTFALMLTTLCFANLLDNSPLRAVQALTVATVIFRCDMVLLLAPLSLMLLITRVVSFKSLLLTGRQIIYIYACMYVCGRLDLCTSTNLKVEPYDLYIQAFG